MITHAKVYKRFGLLVTVMLAATMLVSLGLTTPVAAQTAFANDAFEAAWRALDGPVASGAVQRPYLWGTPGQILDEEYREAKNGKRQVQYFDKGRMELTRPETVGSPNYVGDGRLVVEMITGRVQVGDDRYLQYDGAEIPISGDNTFARNSGAPSYRAFQSLLNPNLAAIGSPIRAVLPPPEDEGYFLGFYSLTPDPALGTLATGAYYAQTTGHTIPDVFWSYLNQPGTNGEALFNWQTLFGLPLTDAYWTKVRANGQPQDVLVQPFERRVLLYNPALPKGLQVESGNVGQDYYRWRYQLPELGTYDNTPVPPDEGNGSVTPKIGEGGTRFVLRGAGFKPNEKISAWFQYKRDGGVYDYSNVARVQIRGDGTFLFVVSLPLFYGFTDDLRYVAIGAESGNKVVLNFRNINSWRYTPGLEAAQPSDVPPAINAALDRNVVKVGEDNNLVVIGFKPGERLRGWITTPLSRVASWEGLVLSVGLSSGDYPARLFADKNGSLKFPIPAPGSAQPGIYAFTVQGLDSGAQAVAYFRVRTGTAAVVRYGWGTSGFTFSSNQPPANQTLPNIDLSKLPIKRDSSITRLSVLEPQPLEEGEE